jgi:hypothetical protein
MPKQEEAPETPTQAAQRHYDAGRRYFSWSFLKLPSLLRSMLTLGGKPLTQAEYITERLEAIEDIGCCTPSQPGFFALFQREGT